MLKFCSLYSGSSGNSSLVQSKNINILVDAGVSGKKIIDALASINVDIENISAILITHEHSDHIKALPVLLKKVTCPVYGTAPVLEYISRNLKISAHTALVPLEDKPLALHDLEVRAFSTPHDSVGSVGYQFQTHDDKLLAVATDLGHMTEEIMSFLLPCKAILLESNYDDGMLMCSSYPYILKRRIASSMGHLSNTDCASAAVRLAQNGVEHLILGHLSQNNNLPALAFTTTKNALELSGCTSMNLCVAKRSQVSDPIRF